MATTDTYPRCDWRGVYPGLEVGLNYSLTQHGKLLEESKYTLDKESKVFSSNEDGLVLDFKEYSGWTFKVKNDCFLKTGSHCTLYLRYNCTFDTGPNCKCIRR